MLHTHMCDSPVLYDKSKKCASWKMTSFIQCLTQYDNFSWMMLTWVLHYLSGADVVFNLHLRYAEAAKNSEKRCMMNIEHHHHHQWKKIRLPNNFHNIYTFLGKKCARCESRAISMPLNRNAILLFICAVMEKMYLEFGRWYSGDNHFSAHVFSSLVPVS